MERQVENNDAPRRGWCSSRVLLEALINQQRLCDGASKFDCDYQLQDQGPFLPFTRPKIAQAPPQNAHHSQADSFEIAQSDQLIHGFQGRSSYRHTNRPGKSQQNLKPPVTRDKLQDVIGVSDLSIHPDSEQQKHRERMCRSSNLAPGPLDSKPHYALDGPAKVTTRGRPGKPSAVRSPIRKETAYRVSRLTAFARRSSERGGGSSSLPTPPLSPNNMRTPFNTHRNGDTCRQSPGDDTVERSHQFRQDRDVIGGKDGPITATLSALRSNSVTSPTMNWEILGRNAVSPGANGSEELATAPKIRPSSRLTDHPTFVWNEKILADIANRKKSRLTQCRDHRQGNQSIKRFRRSRRLAESQAGSNSKVDDDRSIKKSEHFYSAPSRNRQILPVVQPVLSTGHQCVSVDHRSCVTFKTHPNSGVEESSRPYPLSSYPATPGNHWSSPNDDQYDIGYENFVEGARAQNSSMPQDFTVTHAPNEDCLLAGEDERHRVAAGDMAEGGYLSSVQSRFLRTSVEDDDGFERVEQKSYPTPSTIEVATSQSSEERDVSGHLHDLEFEESLEDGGIEFCQAPMVYQASEGSESRCSNAELRNLTFEEILAPGFMTFQ